MSRENVEVVRLKVRCSSGDHQRPLDVRLLVAMPAVARLVARSVMRVPHGRLRRSLVRWAACRLRDTFNRRELDTLPVLVHPAAEAHFGGSTPLAFDLDPIHYGASGFRQALESWLSGWASFHADLLEVVDAGDRLVLLFEFVGTGERSRMQLQQRMGQTYVFDKGWVSRFDAVWDWNEALEAVGLRE